VWNDKLTWVESIDLYIRKFLSYLVSSLNPTFAGATGHPILNGSTLKVGSISRIGVYEKSANETPK
jgi:hypothetical protein